MSPEDTRSEYEKPLEYPLCAKCGREIIRCGHHWVYTLPRGEQSSETTTQREQRFERERERALALVEQGRMSASMLGALGFEERVERIETLVDQVVGQVAARAVSAQPTLLAEPTTPAIYVVLDTETTGRGGNHQPIEIAAKCIDASGVAIAPAKCFWIRLRLFEGVRLDPTALAVHGLDCESAAWNASAVDPTEALRKLAAWWPAGGVLAAHNAAFDVGMLERAFDRAGVERPAWGTPLCTLQLARRNGYKPSGLEALCTRFGISNEGAHGARADVNRLIAVWPHIQRRAA